jgi:integrase
MSITSEKNICDYESDELFYDFILKTPKLRIATKQTYIFALKRITSITKKPLCISIESANVTFKKLREQITSKSSLKTTVATVLAVMKYTGEKTRNQSLFEKWYRIYKPLVEDAEKNRKANKPTDRQLDTMINWEDVVKVYKGNTITNEQRLLLAMYCLVPPRRQQDYFAVNLTKSKTSNDESYIDLKNGDMVIKHFKTVDKYNTWSTKLPKELITLITESLKERPREYLFVMNSGKSFSNRNSFTKYSNRILEKIFGKKVTVNCLRHAFSTWRNSDRTLTIGERMDDAAAMGHSLETHLSYALKIEP